MTMSDITKIPARTDLTFLPDLYSYKSKDDEEERKKNIKTELYKVISNWESVFSSLVCEFIQNYDLYRGTGGITRTLNTKNSIFNPIVKQSIEDIVSYLKTNPRSITVNIRNQKEIQDVVNEIISKLMNDNHLYNKILKAFTDHLVYGISLFKIESDSERVINIKNVDIKSCVWDTNCDYDDFKPSFFICEYMENNFTASNKYGYKVTENESERSSLNRLNTSRNSLLENVRSITKDSETVSVYYGDDVFNHAKKKLSKAKVSDGWTQILEYYVLENIKDPDSKEVTKHYIKYVFANGNYVEESIVPYDSFPFISMAKYVHDHDRICDMFESKVRDMKAEIIQVNIIENSIADAISCHANGALIIKKSAIQDKDKTAKELRSGVILIDESGDGKLGDVMVNLPPATISPILIEHLNNLKNSIKSKFGLINFDPSMIQAKSGYHESMRLDRESQSLSNMVSVVDNALGELGKKLIVFIQEYAKKSLGVLSDLSDNENASEILLDFSTMLDIKTSVNVSESRESPNNTMRLFNEIKSISDIIGQPLNIPVSAVADMLNASDSTKEMLEQMNSTSDDPLRLAEIREKEASAMSKEADAIKKTAEARDISMSA